MKPWAELSIAAKVGIIMGSLIVLIVIIVVPCVLLIGKSTASPPNPTTTVTTTPTPKDAINFTLVPSINFMCACSTNGSDGRNNMGDLTINGQVLETGLDSVDDLNKYLAVFPVGSNYYNHANSARFQGNLSGFSSWENYVTSVANPITTTGTGVLEVTSDQNPVYIANTSKFFFQSDCVNKLFLFV